MRYTAWACFALSGLLLIGCKYQPVHPDERKAVEKLANMGGEYTLDADGYVVDLTLLGPAGSDNALAEVTGLGKLERLDLTGGPFSDAGLKHLTGLVHLRELNLNSYGMPSPVTDAGMEPLASLQNLDTLVLSYTHVTNAGLATLSELHDLRRLYVVGTRVTDSGLVHVEGMNKLEVLRAGQTGVTAGGLEALKRKLPKLEKYKLPSLRRESTEEATAAASAGE